MSSDETDFFEIDPNRLDEEWVRQPALYHEYALKLAEAKKKVRQAEVNLEVTEAELKLDIQKNPSKYGLDKVTVEILKAAVSVQTGYLHRRVELMDAQHEEEIYKAAVFSCDHKKKGLENLVQLRLSDYWSEPRIKGTARETMDDSRKRNVRSKGREVDA